MGPTRTNALREKDEREIVYWSATGLVAIVALLGGFSYVTNAPEAVENFRHVGYPQQLRALLGIAKLAGAIGLLLPRLPTLKEWAYAGFTFTWIVATVAHQLAADGLSLLPVTLLVFLAVSYVTRPATRRGFATSMLAEGAGSTRFRHPGRTKASAVASKIFHLVSSGRSRFHIVLVHSRDDRTRLRRVSTSAATASCDPSVFGRGQQNLDQHHGALDQPDTPSSGEQISSSTPFSWRRRRQRPVPVLPPDGRHQPRLD